jgi:hypothetical protein
MNHEACTTGVGGMSGRWSACLLVSVMLFGLSVDAQVSQLPWTMDISAELGTGAAFPSQTTHLAQETPLSSETRAPVQQRRERGELPVPDFRQGQADDLSEQIGYPPSGSSLLGPDVSYCHGVSQRP